MSTSFATVNTTPEIDKLSLITKDETVLRKLSYQVDLKDDKEIDRLKTLANTMYSILLKDETAPLIRSNLVGYGLSAVQLKGLEGLEAPRLSVVILPEEKRVKAAVYKMVNPQILAQSKAYKYKGEGCLSLPGVFYNTYRFGNVCVGFVDLDTLMPREIEFYGIEAVVMQHEIGHHNGQLFTDFAFIPKVAEKKQGPNDLCSCGSEKKYKRCCG